MLNLFIHEYTLAYITLKVMDFNPIKLLQIPFNTLAHYWFKLYGVFCLFRVSLNLLH